MNKEMQRTLSSSLFAFMGTFIMFSIAEIFWGVFTPGDFYGNGHEYFVMSTFVAALIFGGVSGYKGTSQMATKVFFLVLFLMFVGYWLFAPEVWWVHPLLPRR